MLSKRKYPYLNRAQRRHPEKLVGGNVHVNKGWALPPLTAALLLRAGLNKVAA